MINFKFSLILIIVFFSACSTKITIKSLKPSKINDSDIKQISLKHFKNDNIGLGNIIIKKMQNVKYNNKQYFNVVNRDILTTVLNEQKLQDSGIVNNSKNIELLADVRSIISGEISTKDYTRQFYYNKKIDYQRCVSYAYDKHKKRYCQRYRVINQRCENIQYDLSVFISINKISNSNTIYSRTFDEHREYNRCDYSTILKSKHLVYKDMSNIIANKFIRDITPRYEYKSVEVLDEKDISYTSKQSSWFDKGINYIEDNEIRQANNIFLKLNKSLHYKSYTALYNLALTYESLDSLEEALKYYNDAFYISKGKQIISKSIQRVKLAIKTKKIAIKQINN